MRTDMSLIGVFQVRAHWNGSRVLIAEDDEVDSASGGFIASGAFIRLLINADLPSLDDTVTVELVRRIVYCNR